MAEPENKDQSNSDSEQPKPELTKADSAKPEKTNSSPLKGSRGWMLLAAVIVGAGLLVFASGRHLSDVGKVSDAIVKATQSTGVASIGGPFQLTDHNARRVTEKTFAGKYMLVYFGYTYCPDVCPTGLTKISNALDILGPAADEIAPIFITIDPARDTPEQLREYATYFHPRLLGLTGTMEEISAVAGAYRVYFAKVDNKEPGADPEDYTVDHSAIGYLMGPDGAFRQHFSHDTDAETMAKRIKEIVAP